MTSRDRFLIRLLGIFCCALASDLPLAGQDEYQVGVAKVDITPDYPVRLNGFGSRREESAGVSQRLWAKALAISAGEQPPVIVFTCDNLGIREPMLEQVAAELWRRHQIPRENITLTFTHTHSAPKVRGASDTIFSTPIPPEHQAHIDRYTDELTRHLIDVACAAVEQRATATLEWNIGKITFARNRRTPGGPVDHDLPTLVVRGEDRKPRAIYTTYACHCVTLAFNQISGDWAGYAQEYIERQFPDCIAMVSIGCGSDSNPQSGVTGDNLVAASDQGREIATEVKRLLEQPLHSISGPIDAKLTHIEVALDDPPTREELEARVKQGGPIGFNAQSQLAKLAAGNELQRALHYPIHTLTFGDDLHMVFLAGEVCVDYSLRLKEMLDRDRIWLHGYSNDFCAYIPSERLLQEGGYGGGDEISYFDLPARLKTGVERQIIDAVLQQSPAGFQVQPGTQGIAPKSPERSLQCMRTHDDLHIELVAAEPLVSDPVAIDFGPDGRLWVAEMPDYTRPVEEEFEPHGRVRFLNDDDQDGRFDRATDFLEGLRFPTDVKVWRDGVLVCDAPDIIFAADRDGDGRAEVREVLFTGFATHNPHARVNSLRWGLDGWVYGSGGLFGGKIKNVRGEEVDVSNRDFRLKPDEGIIEGVTGQTQQGRTRDDFDNWFGCTNSELLLHYPLREEYARRNPHVSLPPTIVSVPDEAHGQRLFPPPDLVLFKLTGAPGRPTSACGAEIYRDKYLGDEYYGNAFVCEPVNQLVHRMVLTPNGCTFSGSRHPSEANSEFVTSTDRWFRPVQARTGPDGALWIVDMYRYVIEHPRWIPPETIPELDLMAGQGMGRIYRVVRKDVPPPQIVRLSEMDDADLAFAINSPNGVQRDLAEQMLIWRDVKDPIDLAALHLQIGCGGRTEAVGVQAASTLAVLELLSSDEVLMLLDGRSPYVRQLAIRYAESLGDLPPRQIQWLDLIQEIAESWDDEDPSVVAQVANTLGKVSSKESLNALIQIANRANPDPYVQAAILSSITAENAVEISNLLAFPEFTPFHVEFAKALLNTASEPGIYDVIDNVIRNSRENIKLTDRWRVTAMMLDVFERRNLDVHDVELRSKADLFCWLMGCGDLAANSLERGDQDSATNIAALRLLGRQVWGRLGNPSEPPELGPADLEKYGAVINSRINAQFGSDVQTAAVDAILRFDPDAGCKFVISQLASLTPKVKRSAIDLLLTSPTWQAELLTALENRAINIGDFDAARRQRLLELEHAELRARAEKVFGAVAAPSELVKTWEPALGLTGDVERGRIAYVKVCSTCHVLDGVGSNVGPDLAALTTKTPASILVSVLDPNREVDGRYLSYSALLNDGKTFSGLLVSETATSVTLREQGGKDHLILRQDLDELRSMKKSVMPEGLEKDLSQQAMADLIAYLMPSRTPPKSFEGNHPEVIRPNADGTITLSAATAEIYGGPIIFESGSPFLNIGFWQGPNDFVGWPIELPESRSFMLQLDYACAPDSAGNHFRVDGFAAPVRGTVTSTGAWSTYQVVELGQVTLPAGRSYVSVRFDGRPQASALMDLRAMKLVPSKVEPANEPGNR